MIEQQAHSQQQETVDQPVDDLGALFASFYGNEEAATEEPETASEDLYPIQSVDKNFFIHLSQDAEESITTLSTKVTAETFAAGASFTSSVFSSLGAVVGSCGLFCSHGLGSLMQSGNAGLTNLSSISNASPFNFGVDGNGNFHLDGDLKSLSQSTGISESNLLSGNFSAQDLLQFFSSIFGESLSTLFGFGLVTDLIDTLFDSLLPKPVANGST